MNNWIKILLISLAISMSFTVHADGFGGTNNNDQPEDKPDPNDDDDDGCDGKPVYLSNGIEVYDQTDLAMNGLYQIVLKRYYSSSTDYDSSLGFGWAFEHDKRLFEYPDNSIMIRYGCGWKDRFVESGGQYQSPQGGLEGSLVENPDGTYERTYRDGSKDFYDTEGRLVKNQSPYGHYHEYTYDPAGLLPLTGVSDYALDPNTPMVVANQYRLIRIEEFAADGITTGNRVEFNYNSTTGRLISAVAKTALDDVGRTITYAHDTDGVAKGRLEQVIGLEGIESTYVYSTTNSRLITSFQEGANTTPYVNTYENIAPFKVQYQDYGTNSNSNDDESQYRLTFGYPTSTYQSTVRKTVYDHEDKLLYQNVETKYAFDDAGYVNKITDPYGNEKRITRDALFNLRREEFWTNRGSVGTPDLVLSKAVDYVFDADGNKRQETVHGGGRWTRTSWTYDHGWIASEEVTSNHRDAKTFRTEYTFYRDGLGIPNNVHEIKRLKDDDTYQVTTLTHDSKNRINSVQYPDGHIVRIEYELGSLYPTHVYHEVAGIESPYLNYRMDYDDWGNINSVIDAKSQVTNLVYDDLDRIIQVTNALNESTFYRYIDNRLDELEIGATATDGEGLIYKFYYTSKEELMQVRRKDESGVFQNLWSYEYDSVGNMLNATDAMGRVWSYTYDYLDRMSSLKDPLDNQWQYEYDILDNVTRVIDAQQNVTQYRYDGSNRIIKIEELGAMPGLVTQIVYDAMGNMTQVVNPNYQITRNDYDRLSRLVKTTKPLGQSVTYTYDSRDRLDYLINENNQKIDYDYEPWGSLKDTLFFDTPASTTFVKQRTRVYDYNGNLTSIIDTGVMPTSLYTWAYDELDRTSSTVNFSFTPFRQIEYDYDRFGNVNQLRVSNSMTANGTDWIEEYTQLYQFNRQDLLKQMTFVPGQQILLDYYPSDELKQIRYNSGTQVDYAYFGNGPLKWVDVIHGGVSKEKIRFSYDKLLNVKEIGSSQGVHSFVYDGLDRLISATHPSGLGLPPQENYSYDPAGNREDLTDSSLYDYDRNNRVQQSPGVNGYIFDDAGNLNQRGTNEVFIFDHENQLTQYSNIATDVTARYTYDPFGRRIRKVVIDSGVTSTTNYLWDDQDLISEFDGSGVRVKRYAYSPEGYAPIQIEDSNGVYDVHTDHLDAPVFLTNTSGDMVWRADYEAYGQAQVNEDVDGNAQIISFDLRRPGQWIDAESGLFYNYHRYYDPKIGRYISSDPLGLDGLMYELGDEFLGSDTNLYSYVRNNPEYYIDPEGLAPIVPICIGAAKACAKNKKCRKAVKDSIDWFKKRRNLTKRHSTKKRAKDKARHAHKGKPRPTPKKTDKKKREQYNQQQKYKNSERHKNSRHNDSHYHDSNKGRQRNNNHRTYPRGR